MVVGTPSNPMVGIDDFEIGVMLSATTNDYPMPASEYADAFERLATTAEAAGLDAVVAGDHIAYPRALSQNYPFTPTGEPPFGHDTDLHDVFQVLATLAAVTEDITLGTNVCVAPLRHPVTLAKQALSLDSLSGGRFELGVGAGWLASEYEVLDIPFNERGGRLDEFLEILERARKEPAVAFNGEYHSFQSTGFYPRPTGDLPVMIGGESGATVRRIGQFGDGWTAVGAKPSNVANMCERIQAAWSDFERKGEPEIAVLRPIDVDLNADNKDLLTGHPDAVRADVERYREAGATRLLLDFYTRDIDEQVTQLRRFGEDVLGQ